MRGNLPRGAKPPRSSCTSVPTRASLDDEAMGCDGRQGQRPLAGLLLGMTSKTVPLFNGERSDWRTVLFRQRMGVLIRQGDGIRNRPCFVGDGQLRLLIGPHVLEEQIPVLSGLNRTPCGLRGRRQHTTLSGAPSRFRRCIRASTL